MTDGGDDVYDVVKNQGDDVKDEHRNVKTYDRDRYVYVYPRFARIKRAFRPSIRGRLLTNKDKSSRLITIECIFK